ncbi:polycystin-1-like protein 3 [Glandiceps talaboti]
MVDGCQAQLSDINGQFVCLCDHLTGFTAAEFVVPVNKLEFTFDQDIRDNAVVLIVILSFFGVYILLALLLRRKDKQDLVKWMILPLIDNKSEDNYLYKVTVYTGIKPFSGTECDVYFNIVGENGESGVRCLKDKKGKILRLCMLQVVCC